MKMFQITRTRNDDGTITRDLYPKRYMYSTDVIRASLEARCQIIRGELSYNNTLGLPLGSNKDALDLAVSNIILSTHFIDSIKEFESSIVNKKYSARIVVITDTGDELEASI